jgi:hypothetical protein
MQAYDRVRACLKLHLKSLKVFLTLKSPFEEKCIRSVKILKTLLRVKKPKNNQKTLLAKN